VSPRGVRLDFVDPMAKLRVEVMYRGASITKDTRLQIIRRGDRDASYGTGNEVFHHEGVPGEVDLKVTYMGAVSVDKDISGVILKRGEITKVTVELDDLLGTLRVKVKAGDKDVTSKSEVKAQSEQHKLQLSPKGDLLVAIIPAGFYGVQATYQRNRSNLAEVTVEAGQITDVTLEVEVPGENCSGAHDWR